MNLTNVSEVFFVGILGGVLLELIHWWNLRRTNSSFPEYARSWFYWLVTIFMILAGGAVAVFYFGDQAEAIITLHVGISAPLILQKLSTSMAQPGARSLKATSLRNFFNW